jgi:hypothetical protein
MNFTRGKVIPKRWVVELTKAEKKNADGFFRIVNENSKPLFKWSLLLFSRIESKDIEQALRDNAEKNNIRKHYRRFSKNARIAHKTA